ncbi:DUF3817 domain-containing protein [Pseudonocardia spinosispora]|uniref:DUF3817 domain-containing protein n=1 Tax=Pseudonocardia spinosispora TaxID=103441 RepID=UPI0003F6A037|nr:DUF3817 domain-containing protein [Pseudonocardia spinosispora]
MEQSRDESYWFRISAIAEAISWTGLLIGMVFKYLVVFDEIGVKIFGPIHGVLFLVYVALTIVVWRRRNWSTGVGLWALFSSIPPYGTIVFERWATRHGKLAQATGALS